MRDCGGDGGAMRDICGDAGIVGGADAVEFAKGVGGVERAVEKDGKGITQRR